MTKCNIIKHIIQTVLFLFLNVILWAQEKPYLYWTFNMENALLDNTGEHLLKPNNCSYERIQSPVGKALDLQDQFCSFNTSALSGTIKDVFTIEFMFKGGKFEFRTFAKQALLLRFGYAQIYFRTTHKRSGGVDETHDFSVRLNGSGMSSYDYYNDGNWHHIVFTANTATGIKRIWIDGMSQDEFSTSIPKGAAMVFGANDGFVNTDGIDELAFYDIELPADVIQQHAYKASKGLSYYSDEKLIRNDITRFATEKKALRNQSGVDGREFAPGYPRYTVQATEQLKSFPGPRYNPERKMPRNFPWMDIATYMHRELSGDGEIGTGKANPERVVEMIDILAKKWNYYVEVPCLRLDTLTAAARYNNKGSIENAIINYARSHPEIPTSSVLMQVQGKPFHAGFDSKTAYINSQSLPEMYYMQDRNGNVMIFQGKKWLSPLAPTDVIEKDALTTIRYLKELERSLGRPIDFLNDNGEVFGHIRPLELLEKDPGVWRDFQQSGLTVSAYSARFQNRLDSIYKNIILKTMNWNGAIFTFYNVSAYNPSYWPEYSLRRSTNTVLSSGFHYSTPSFYPANPGNWRTSSGPLNGYSVVADGRRREIALGDTLFAPFVSAGWGLEEGNIRPGQWLGLLKALVMLGAEFFHVGYFNVTGSTGWPNGKGPNDPRGYVYQAAMPAYAQASVSWVYDLWRNSEILNVRPPEDSLVYTYRIPTSKENHLVIVRKLGQQYLIFGTVQPNSNEKGNAPVDDVTSIQLDGRQIDLSIRRQGSLYVLDISRPDSPVIRQLDGWHEYEHPYYWSKQVEVEFENINGVVADIVTEKENEESFDFRSFVTYAVLRKGEQLQLSIPERSKPEAPVSLFLKKRSGTPVLTIQSKQGSILKTLSGKNSNLQEIRLSTGEIEQLKIASSGEVLRILVDGGDVLLDKCRF